MCTLYATSDFGLHTAHFDSTHVQQVHQAVLGSYHWLPSSQRQKLTKRQDSELRRKQRQTRPRSCCSCGWIRVCYNLAAIVQRSLTEQSLRRIDPNFSSILDTPYVRQSGANYCVQDCDGTNELALAGFLEEVIS